MPRAAPPSVEMSPVEVMETEPKLLVLARIAVDESPEVAISPAVITVAP